MVFRKLRLATKTKGCTMLTSFKINPLLPPEGHQKVLLHSCCAPCSCALMESMLASNIELAVFFYNPNIDPYSEYERRKRENIRFAAKLGIPFIDADEDRDAWLKRTSGMENEPECGQRCTVCFDMRLDRAARYAHEHGFHVLATSLGISRRKNIQQVNACGQRAAARYPGLIFWDHNWRKGGGDALMIEIAAREKFYRQEYCGCIYSLRETNARRIARGRPAVEIEADCAAIGFFD
jgi:hypothetical protein